MRKLQKNVSFMILDGPAIIVLAIWMLMSPGLVPFILLVAVGFLSLVIGLWHVITGDASIDPDKN